MFSLLALPTDTLAVPAEVGKVVESGLVKQISSRQKYEVSPCFFTAYARRHRPRARCLDGSNLDYRIVKFCKLLLAANESLSGVVRPIR